MNKKQWISILLDETLSDEDIMSLVDQSYQTTVICEDSGLFLLLLNVLI